MKLLIDTNVILDVLCNRPDFVEDASKIFKLCEIKKVDGYISALSVPNIVYIMRKELDSAKIKEILEKIIFLATAKARFNNKPLIPIAKETHYIARTISAVNTLDYHLFLSYVLGIFNDFGEHKYTISLKLIQCFVSNLASKLIDIRKNIFFML